MQAARAWKASTKSRLPIDALLDSCPALSKMTSCTALPAAKLPRAFRCIQLQLEVGQEVKFPGLLKARLLKDWQVYQTRGYSSFLSSWPTQERKSRLDVGRSMKIQQPEATKVLMRPGPTQTNNDSFFIVEYGIGEQFWKQEKAVFIWPPQPTFVMSGAIGPEKPARFCNLYATDDKSLFSLHAKDQAKALNVVVSPWRVVINSLHRAPAPAPMGDFMKRTGKTTTYHLLEYEYVPEILQKREPYREAHLKLATERCLFAGPKGDPVDGGLLLFATDDESVVRDYVSQDPYVAAGLVTAHRIRPWRIDASNAQYFEEGQKQHSPEEKNSEIESTSSGKDRKHASPPGSEERRADPSLLSRISSMSGFSRVDGAHKNKLWSWEVKSVNGRSLDVRSRLPNSYSALEQAATTAAAERFARGSISCSLDVKVDPAQQEKQLVIKEQAMLQAANAVDSVRVKGPSLYNSGGLLWGDILRIPGVCTWEEPEEPEEEREELLRKMTLSLHDAMDDLLANRVSEGDRLRVLLSEQVAELEAVVDQAAQKAQERLPQAKERLQRQVAELLDTSRALDPGRLEQEVALLAIKMDVREEIDRLRSHIVAAKELLNGGQKPPCSPKKGQGEAGALRPVAIGRQLDFLCQEFTRESSTICSKSNDIPLTQLGIQMKAISEQIKEQAANVQ